MHGAPAASGRTSAPYATPPAKPVAGNTAPGRLAARNPDRSPQGRSHGRPWTNLPRPPVWVVRTACIPPRSNKFKERGEPRSRWRRGWSGGVKRLRPALLSLPRDRMGSGWPHRAPLPWRATPSGARPRREPHPRSRPRATRRVRSNGRAWPAARRPRPLDRPRTTCTAQSRFCSRFGYASDRPCGRRPSISTPPISGASRFD